MVAADLLELGDRGREPVGEALVEVRALLLRQRLVRGVPEQQVLEPERFLARRAG